jgi:hypothetical protein
LRRRSTGPPWRPLPIRQRAGGKATVTVALARLEAKLREQAEEVLALVASSVGKDFHWWSTGAAAPLRVRDGRRGKRREKMVGPTVLRGGWRASRNGGWEWEFGGVWKIEVHMKALLELVFPPNLQILE